MRVLIFIIASAAIFLLNSITANASSCSRPTPQEHIDGSDLVFFGQVVDASKDTRDGEMRTINVKILRNYKGANIKSIKIKYINDGGGNMGWGFNNHQSVLIFAQKDEASTVGNVIGTVYYCDMITYHGRTNLHPQYWDHLVKIK